MRRMRLGYPVINTFASRLEHQGWADHDALIAKAKKIKEENPGISFLDAMGKLKEMNSEHN